MKKRAEFNRMIAACKRGRIDMILTKSASRFARNTVDCLKVIRALKARGIAVIFEKENINTLPVQQDSGLPPGAGRQAGDRPGGG